MVPSLRKTHRRIWILLAILLPILYVAAIVVIPDEVEQEVLYQDSDSTQIEQQKSQDSNQKQQK